MITTTLTPAEAKRFYDRLGARLDSQAFYEDPAIDNLIAHADFEHARAVLEFGCGTGRLAERLLSRHLTATSQYLGLDISSTMVSLARTRLYRWADRSRVQQSDGAITLPLPPGRFDRCVSTYVLDLLSPEDIRMFLAEAHRVLSTDGRLCLVTLTYGVGPLTRLVSWSWERIYSLSPRMLGGCRPLRLGPILPVDAWASSHDDRVSSVGVTSEVVVASPKGPRIPLSDLDRE